MKKFTVSTSGKVLQEVIADQTYIISADSEEEAKNIGREKFVKDFQTNLDYVSVGYTMPHRKKILIFAFACLCFLISMFLVFREWFPDGAHTSISIAPTLKTLVYSSFFILGIYIKVKDIRSFNNQFFINLALLLMNILICASFVSILTSTAHIKIFGYELLAVQTDYLLIFAVLFSWGGIKIVSVACYFLLALFALTNFSIISDVMHFFGVIYFLTSVSFLISYISIDPQLLSTFPLIERSFYRSYNYLKNETRQSLE
ncbi:MAG: hypothetical protein Q4A90_02475 [Streptococcus sp.]|nr:hypothetical protein [Streptococcus sp.]